MVKTVKQTTVPKHLYANYLKKAQQFHAVMEFCFQDGEWDAVLLNGLHACISITDAVLVFQSGIRSISSNHQDAVRLLNQSLEKDLEINKQTTRLSKIIDEKNKVAYESKLHNEKETKKFRDQVIRYFDWALTKLPL